MLSNQTAVSSSGTSRRNQHVEYVMTPNEIARVQDYLRRTFGNDRITIVPPPKRGAPIEMLIGDEFIGVVHRDEDEGEVSHDLHITILSEDSPQPAQYRPARRVSRRVTTWLSGRGPRDLVASPAAGQRLGRPAFLRHESPKACSTVARWARIARRRRRRRPERWR